MNVFGNQNLPIEIDMYLGGAELSREQLAVVSGWLSSFGHDLNFLEEFFWNRLYWKKMREAACADPEIHKCISAALDECLREDLAGDAGKDSGN